MNRVRNRLSRLLIGVGASALIAQSFAGTLGNNKYSLRAPVASAIGHSFLENKGQWDSSVLFFTQDQGLRMWGTKSGMVLDVFQMDHRINFDNDAVNKISRASRRYGQVISLDFVGATGNAVASGRNPGSLQIDFLGFAGRNDAQSVKAFEEGTIRHIMPGVDLRLYRDVAGPRYDVIVAPGIDPSQIRIDASGANGLSLLENGSLGVHTVLGVIEMKGLLAYQMVNGRKQQVQAAFNLVDKDTFGFNFGSYDASKPLVIDPLVYGSHFGGTDGYPATGSYDEVFSSTSDSAGNLYYCGNTTSTDLPITEGPYGTEFLSDGAADDQDGFVAKLQGDAYNVTYVCYVGGPGSDSVERAQVDQYGNVWLAGDTQSDTFLEGGHWVVETVPATQVSPRRTITGGDFRFGYRGFQTDNIAFDATAQDVEDHLNNDLPGSILPPGGFTVAGGPLPDAEMEITAAQPVFPLRLIQKTRKYSIAGNNEPDPSDIQGIFPNNDPNDFGWIPNTGTFRLQVDQANVTAQIPFDADRPTVIAALTATAILSANPVRVIPSGPLAGPLPATAIVFQFMTGGATSQPETRELLTITEDLVDGGLLRFQPVPRTTFLTKFAPSTTTVLDPFVNKVVQQINGATDFVDFSVRPVDTATGLVEFALVGTGGTVDNVPGTPPVGSGFTPTHGFLLYARYTQGSTNLQFTSSRSTYIGGTANADARSVKMDASGAIYVAGNVWLHDPVDTDPLPPDINTNATLGENSSVFYASNNVFVNGNLLRKQDGYLRKYNPNGTYAFSCILGGSNDDFVASMAIDTSGNAYLTGNSGSFNFPRSVAAFDQTIGAGESFVTKISGDGRSILYSTGLAAPNAGPTGISIDSRGNAYVVGATVKPLVGEGITLTPAAPFLTGQEDALDRLNSGNLDLDAFLTVLNSTAVGLLYSSYAGEAASQEIANHVQNDSTGSVWVCGFTAAYALGPWGIGNPYLSPLAFKPGSDGVDGWLFKMRIVLPVLQGITVTPTQTAGGLGASADVNVTLRQPAPAGGTTVTVKIVDSTYARFNSANGPTELRVLIPAGATQFTAPVTVFTREVPSPTFTDIRAELDGDFVQTRLNIRPWIESFLLSTTQITGGSIVDGTVTIFLPAPAAGIPVDLSTDSTLISFPGGTSVVIPAGAQTIAVPIQTSAVAVPTDVNVTVTIANVSITQPLRIIPPRIDNIIVDPNRISGGEGTSATVFMNGPVAVPTSVTISQIGQSITLPATVTIPANATQASFNITTPHVAVDTSTRVRATFNSTTVEDTLFLVATDVASVQLSSYNVLGGGQVTGRVNLTRPAGPTGLNMPMITNNPTAGTIIPANVFIAPGASFGTFTVQTNVVPTTQTMRVVTAKAGGFNNTGVTLTVRALSVGLVFNPTQVVGGIQNSTGTITLGNGEIAPTGGIRINLSSSVPGTLSVPASVTIPAGSNAVTFTASSAATSFDRNVTVTANLSAGFSVSAVVRVLAPRVTTLTLSPISVTGGQSSIGTVRVDAPAPTGGLLIGLSSSVSQASVPGSVTIPAGQTSATFTITTLPVAAKVNATIRAIGNSTSQSAILQIYPPSVSSFTFSPASVQGGQNSVGRIILNGPAPVGGLTITLTNNNPSFVEHTATVVVSAGQTEVTFICGTEIVTRWITVRVTAQVPDRGPVNGYLTITGTP